MERKTSRTVIFTACILIQLMAPLFTFAKDIKMEGETTLKHRTLTGKSDEDVNSTPASTETGKTVTENHGKMNDKDEDDKIQSEAWQKYKSMSFMDKYKMEKSARVPSVMYYGDVFFSFQEIRWLLASSTCQIQ